MSLLLIPILAQVVSAEVGDRAKPLASEEAGGLPVLSAEIGDRIEPRYVREEGNGRLEAENLAYLTVGLELEPLKLSAAYAPRILLEPLERSPREFSVTHTLVGRAIVEQALYESRRDTMTFHLEGDFTQADQREELLGAPLPTSPERPDDPTAPPTSPDRTSEDLVQITNITTRSGNARGALSASERVSKRNTFAQYAGYGASGGFDDDSRVLYPFTHGPDAGLSYIHLLSRRDVLTSTATAELSFVPEREERLTDLRLAQGIGHQFSRRTLGEASAGVAYVRSATPEQGGNGDVVPTGRLGLSYNTPLGHGRLALHSEAGYGPVLDRTTLAFDTRFDALWSLTWTKGKWDLYTTADAAISSDTSKVGALRRVTGSSGANYEIGSGFFANVGGRTLWESYEGRVVVPPTWVGFVALTWTYKVEGLRAATKSESVPTIQTK